MKRSRLISSKKIGRKTNPKGPSGGPPFFNIKNLDFCQGRGPGKLRLSLNKVKSSRAYLQGHYFRGKTCEYLLGGRTIDVPPSMR